MPLCFDVTCEAEHQALFPPRCVACGEEGPSTRWASDSERFALFHLMASSKGERFSVLAPACAPCSDKMTAQRRFRRLSNIFLPLGLFVLLIAGHHALGDEDLLPKSYAVGGALLGVIPLILYQLFNPPPFAVLSVGQTLTYEFADEGYAEAFRALNEEGLVREASWDEIEAELLSEEESDPP